MRIVNNIIVKTCILHLCQIKFAKNELNHISIRLPKRVNGNGCILGYRP